MENANRDGELQELKHQKLKISFETEAITEIVKKAIDDWKEDMHSVDAARYGMHVSLKNLFCSVLPFRCCTSFLLDISPGDGFPLGLHGRVLIDLHTVKVLY